jgi:hypothetical protein
MRRIILLSVAIWMYCSLIARAQEENFLALSIYNFTRYVDWPASDASGDFTIDIIGHKSVYEKLKEVATGRNVGNRTIRVRFLESASNVTESQILFVGFWQSKDMPKVVEKVGNAHTLIISEKDGLIDVGSGINFVIRNNTIKFEIKKANIQKYGLNIGETLLSLAFKSY